MEKIPEYFMGHIKVYPVHKDNNGTDKECLGFTIGGNNGDIKCSSAFYDAENGRVTLYNVYLQTWLKKEYLGNKAQKETLLDNIFYDTWESIGADTLSGKIV